MIRRLIKLFVALTTLSILWGYANSVGVTQAVSAATGYNIPSSFTLPFVDQDLLNGDKKVSPQLIAIETVKKAAREDLGQKAVEGAIEAARKVGVSAQEIKKAYEESVEQSKRDNAVELEILNGEPVVKKPTPKPTPKPTTEAPNPNVYAVALVDAKSLTVKGRAPKTGYDRGQFGSAWTDNVSVEYGKNGCDTRNDILGRDLVNIVFKAGTKNCKVVSGTLEYEPYTGKKNVKFIAGGDYANQLDAEHIVALGDAWQKGAQQWSKAKRTDFANDPINLMMVDPSSNRAKGDADAATWLPPNKSYRCEYVRQQVFIKKTYSLWVTQAERDAMVTVLTPCAK